VNANTDRPVYQAAIEAHEYRRRAELECFAASLLAFNARANGSAWHAKEAVRYLKEAERLSPGGWDG
jgi:hypothetical protein